MPRLQAKRFENPDETRSVPRASLRVVNLDEVTVGLAVWDGTETAAELFERADGALYEAKFAGRDRIRVAGSVGARS